MNFTVEVEHLRRQLTLEALKEDSPTVAFLCCLAAVGIVGNSILLDVYLNVRRKVLSTYLIVGLASVDLCISSVILPLRVMLYYVAVPRYVCGFTLALGYASVSTSIFFFICIAFDRYQAVCLLAKPIITTKHTKYLIMYAVSSSLLAMVLPPIFLKGEVTLQKGNESMELYMREGYPCYVTGMLSHPDRTWDARYILHFVLAMFSIVVILFVIILYSLIFKTLRQTDKFRLRSKATVMPMPLGDPSAIRKLKARPCCSESRNKNSTDTIRSNHMHNEHDDTFAEKEVSTQSPLINETDLNKTGPTLNGNNGEETLASRQEDAPDKDTLFIIPNILHNVPQTKATNTDPSCFSKDQTQDFSNRCLAKDIENTSEENIGVHHHDQIFKYKDRLKTPTCDNQRLMSNVNETDPITTSQGEYRPKLSMALKSTGLSHDKVGTSCQGLAMSKDTTNKQTVKHKKFSTAKYPSYTHDQCHENTRKKPLKYLRDRPLFSKRFFETSTKYSYSENQEDTFRKCCQQNEEANEADEAENKALKNNFEPPAPCFPRGKDHPHFHRLYKNPKHDDVSPTTITAKITLDHTAVYHLRQNDTVGRPDLDLNDAPVRSKSLDYKSTRRHTLKFSLSENIHDDHSHRHEKENYLSSEPSSASSNKDTNSTVFTVGTSYSSPWNIAKQTVATHLPSCNDNANTWTEINEFTARATRDNNRKETSAVKQRQILRSQYQQESQPQHCSIARKSSYAWNMSTRVSLRLFLVTLAYCLCWLPFYLIELSLVEHDSLLLQVFFMAHVMNPVIHFMSSKMFRHEAAARIKRLYTKFKVKL